MHTDYVHVNVYDLSILSDADYRRGVIDCLRRAWYEDMDADDRALYNNDFDEYVNDQYDLCEGCDKDFITIDAKYTYLVEEVRERFGTIDDLKKAYDATILNWGYTK